MKDDLTALIVMIVGFAVFIILLWTFRSRSKDADAGQAPRRSCLPVSRNPAEQRTAPTTESPNGKLSEWWRKIFRRGRSNDGHDGMKMESLERGPNGEQDLASRSNTGGAGNDRNNVDNDEQNAFNYAEPWDDGFDAGFAKHTEVLGSHNAHDGRDQFGYRQEIDEDAERQQDMDNRLANLMRHHSRDHKRSSLRGQDRNRRQEPRREGKREESPSNVNPFSDEFRIEE